MAAVPPCHYFRALRVHPDLYVPENDRYRGPAHFYVARFARTYPVVLLSLGATALVTAYLLNGGDSSLMLEWYSLKSSVYISLAVSLIFQLSWFFSIRFQLTGTAFSSPNSPLPTCSN
jgi:peptidoglycan/LPS O-acetylase OafA/YrhL